MNLFARVLLFLLVVTSWVSVHAYADVAQGLSWLAKQQQITGDVVSESPLAHPFQSTVETILAFDTDNAGVVSLNRTQALEFISNNTELSTEFIVHASLLGIEVDRSGENLLSRLISHQNDDGGFGSFSGFGSNILDTALALTALAKVKNVYPSEVSQAIGYLLTRQHDNGAYSLYLSDLPSLPLTSFVAIALQKYVFDFSNVAQAITSAGQYILNNQLIGVGVENNWQTALSLLAVIPSVRDSARYAVLVENLNNNQFADGSWGSDVYTTALVIQALQLAANITFPQEPDTGLFSGRILDNTTMNPISNVVITLENDTNISSVTDEQGRFILDGVKPGEYTLKYEIAGYYGATQAASVAVGQVTSLGDVRLQRLPSRATISGTITDAVSGQPLPDALIVFSNGGNSVSAVLDSNSIYSVGLESGSFSFTVSSAGYRPLTGSVEVNAGNNIAFSPALHAENIPPAETDVTLFGIVIDELTSVPISGAIINVSGVTIRTEGDGSFRLEGLNEGNLLLTISAQNYLERQLQLVAPAGSKGHLGHIVLTPNEIPDTSSVFGTITDSETGEPIYGATVLLEDTNTTVTSLPTGTYTLANIELQTFNLFVSAPGYWSQRVNFVLGEVGSNRFDVALKPSDSGGFSITHLATAQTRYEAYAPVRISATLDNSSDRSVSTRLFLEVHNENNETVASLPIGDLAGGMEPGAPVIVLPKESVSIEAQWYTGIFPPGKYSIKLSAYDQFTSQVLSEQIGYFDILPTAVISDASLAINSRFSNVGAEDNIVLSLDLVNRSNIPIDFTLDYQWLDPQGNTLKSSHAVFSLLPEQVQQKLPLDEYKYSFKSSGVYPFFAHMTSGQFAASVNSVEVVVAPSIRVEAVQRLLPSVVIPGGDKRITIDITVEGVEQ